MKIRIGFVSNSSSSSFCIVGYDYEFKTPNRFYDYDIDIDDPEFDKDEYSDEEMILIRLNNDVDIDSEPTDYGTVVVGKDIKNMKDEQTLKDFKESVLKELNERIFLEKPIELENIDFIVESTYNY